MNNSSDKKPSCFYYFIRLMRANMPNPRRIKPEIRLTHCMTLKPNFSRKDPTTPLNSSHQAADPQKTPNTRMPEEDKLFFTDAKPNPANMAAKERMVIGLVSVKKKVEA